MPLIWQRRKLTASEEHLTLPRPTPQATHQKDSGKCFLQGSRRNKKAGAVILRLASSRSVLLMDGKAIVAAIVLTIAHYVGSFGYSETHIHKFREHSLCKASGHWSPVFVLTKAFVRFYQFCGRYGTAAKTLHKKPYIKVTDLCIAENFQRFLFKHTLLRGDAILY